ncbi:MAG: zinc ribbon domain-containing protein, partial [Nocardioides sp.]
MPFCTECGHQNPDDARFCSRCGHRIVQEEGGAAPEAAETTATITFGAPAKESDHREEGSLNEADAAAVDAL